MKIFTSPTDPELIALLKQGAVGVVPSDTIYGLMCRAADPVAVTRLYALKARENKPGTVIAGRLQQLIDLGLRARYLKAVEQYWPNPLSVIIPCGDELAYLHQGKRSVAVRVTAYGALQELTRHTGALLTSSANQPGEPPATNLAEAQAYFGDSVDFYVDAGTIQDHAPSTVIRIIDDAIEVVRQGAVKIDENGRMS